MGYFEELRKDNNQSTTKNGTQADSFFVRAKLFNRLVKKLNNIFTSDTAMAVDTISESTSGAGVTIDGVIIKDGTITTTAPTISSVDPAITATGTDDTDGYALTKELNIITGGAANTGVELPTAVVGLKVVVANLTASAKKVYANASDAIDDKTATTGFVTLQPEQVVTFYCYTVALWQSDFEAKAAYDQVYVDTINEFTSTSGVTVDGALIKDGAFDTNVAAAGVTLSGTTLAADGTDANININITPKGTGQIVAGDGAVATPMYTFTSDPDTGFYGLTGNEIGVAAGGALATLFGTYGVSTDAVKSRVSLGTTPVGTVSITECGGR